jgi:hypothetical protein
MLYLEIPIHRQPHLRKMRYIDSNYLPSKLDGNLTLSSFLYVQLLTLKLGEK